MKKIKKIRRKMLVLISIIALFTSGLVVYAEDDTSGNGDELVEETTTLKELVEQGVVFEDVLTETYNINGGGGMLKSLSSKASSLSSGFKLYSGGTINVGGVANPSNKQFRVGILQPDGTIRYIQGTSNIGKAFSVTQTGTHKVYIYNASDVTISISVSYSY